MALYAQRCQESGALTTDSKIAQERHISRIGVEDVETRLDRQLGDRRIAFVYRTRQHRERSVFLAERRVAERDVIRRDVAPRHVLEMPKKISRVLFVAGNR